MLCRSIETVVWLLMLINLYKGQIVAGTRGRKALCKYLKLSSIEESNKILFNYSASNRVALFENLKCFLEYFEVRKCQQTVISINSDT